MKSFKVGNDVTRFEFLKFWLLCGKQIGEGQGYV